MSTKLCLDLSKNVQNNDIESFDFEKALIYYIVDLFF